MKWCVSRRGGEEIFRVRFHTRISHHVVFIFIFKSVVDHSSVTHLSDARTHNIFINISHAQYLKHNFRAISLTHSLTHNKNTAHMLISVQSIVVQSTTNTHCLMIFSFFLFFFLFCFSFV